MFRRNSRSSSGRINGIKILNWFLMSPKTIEFSIYSVFNVLHYRYGFIKVVVTIVTISNKVQKSIIAEWAIEFVISSLCWVQRDPVVYKIMHGINNNNNINTSFQFSIL
jgi:hypothetical protein